MAMVTARLEGFDDLERDLESEPQVIQREFRHEIKSSSNAIATHYRRLGKSHFITGDFDASISADSDNGWETGEVGSDVLYSIFLEVGTKWHPIYAQEADFLHFFSEKFGHWVKTESVEHPGTPAYNLLLKAWIEVMEPFDRTFGERLRKSLERIK